MAHSNWAEWIYLGVVTALLIYVGAEAWNVERNYRTYTRRC